MTTVTMTTVTMTTVTMTTVTMTTTLTAAITTHILPPPFFSDVTILNRATKGERLSNIEVRIGNDKNNYNNNPTCHDRVGTATSNEAVRVQCKPPLPGRYARVQMFGTGILSMCEVLVYSRLGEVLWERRAQYV